MLGILNILVVRFMATTAVVPEVLVELHQVSYSSCFKDGLHGPVLSFEVYIL
jgi:hypothetical protein